jgi:hypothetical protein
MAMAMGIEKKETVTHWKIYVDHLIGLLPD